MKKPSDTWLVAFALQGCVTARNTPQQPGATSSLDEPEYSAANFHHAWSGWLVAAELSLLAT